MGAIQAPDQTPLERLDQWIQAYEKDLLRLCCLYLRDWNAAEDAVQEAFIKFLTKAPEFESDEHCKAWLLRVTVNISKNMLKSARRKNLPLTEEIPYCEKSDGVLPYVLSLDEKYRAVTHLYYYENYSIKEISEILFVEKSILLISE